MEARSHRSVSTQIWSYTHSHRLVGVYGPVESQRKREDMNKADLVVQVHPSCGTSNTYTTTLQHFLHSMFQGQILLLLHPRSAIRIIVHLINEAGSVHFFLCQTHLLSGIVLLLQCHYSCFSRCWHSNAINAGFSGHSFDERRLHHSWPNLWGCTQPKSRQRYIKHSTILFVLTRMTDTTGKASDVKVVAVSSFQFNNKSKMVSEWSQVVPSQTQTISINEDQYLDAVALAKTAATKLHNFFKLTTTSKCLYECHGTAF